MKVATVFCAILALVVSGFALSQSNDDSWPEWKRSIIWDTVADRDSGRGNTPEADECDGGVDLCLDGVYYPNVQCVLVQGFLDQGATLGLCPDEDLECDARIARAEVNGAKLTIEGSGFCDDPVVFMGTFGGGFNELSPDDTMPSTDTKIVVFLVDFAPGTYVVFVDCDGDDEDLSQPVSIEEASQNFIALGQQLELVPLPLGTTSSNGDFCPPLVIDVTLAVGERGPTGPTGPTGTTGPTGPRGPTGPSEGGPTVVCPGTIPSVQIGSWCIDEFFRAPASFVEATETCHADGKRICPVEALTACDILDDMEDQAPVQSQCVLLTDSGSARLWTGTFEPSFDTQVFQGLVVYGGDNEIRMANANEIYPYFCCKSTGSPAPPFDFIPD